MDYKPSLDPTASLSLIPFQSLLVDLEKFAFQGCGKPMIYDTAASGENVSAKVSLQVKV